jgi:hypothetical protein
MELQNIRYVVPAVRSFRSKVNTTAITRRAPKLNYAKARQRWWVHIECNSDIDLYIFEKALSGSEIRLVELEDEFYVEDPRIPDAANMGEATRLAETIVAQLNGSTRVLCQQFNGARIESLVELLENGTGRGIVSYAMAVPGESDFPSIAAFLNGEAVPINIILPMLKSDRDVQEALFYLGDESNVWGNLYKATEIVEDRVGDARALFQSGWCSRGEWERFRRSANHQEAIGRFSRHARSQAAPPPDPMTVTEARIVVSKLIGNWIRSLAARRAASGPTES